eukprot:TRINITY_DN2820_c0_g2_i1.p1 TRINITY_DN2820_c0_g2~~TRINITY_DN2820_c0_g2_i1.p1  ORF type:complete len:146 (+),score=12.76 TRINITY_DN2820_c0_g2_i1:390-827(+)
MYAATSPKNSPPLCEHPQSETKMAISGSRGKEGNDGGYLLVRRCSNESVFKIQAALTCQPKQEQPAILQHKASPKQELRHRMLQSAGKQSSSEGTASGPVGKRALLQAIATNVRKDSALTPRLKSFELFFVTLKTSTWMSGDRSS